jgi:hypothetical protein
MDAPGGRDVAEETLAEIIELEWEMFQGVRGLDGPAPCQQDRRTFDIMRGSQVKAWTEDIAESYVDDLRRAGEAGRNLMTEKYARMMESTSPCECRGVGAVLPELDERTARLVDNIARMSLRWRQQVEDAYPFLSGRGRPIHAWADGRFTTSFETYLRSELATYSSRTLGLIEDHYRALEAAGENPAAIILRDTLERYGFASFEEAEASVKAHAEKRRDAGA